MEEKILRNLTDIVETGFADLRERFGDLETVVHEAVIPRLVNLEAYVHENVATKDGVRVIRNELMDHIDTLALGYKAHDQERLASIYRIDRLERRVEKLERDPGEA